MNWDGLWERGHRGGSNQKGGKRNGKEEKKEGGNEKGAPPGKRKTREGKMGWFFLWHRARVKPERDNDQNAKKKSEKGR